MIIPTLRGEQRVALSHPSLLRRVFLVTPTWHDEVIERQNDSAQYDLLSVISACCTLGLFCYKDGCWRPSRLGYMISMIGPLADPVEVVRNFPFTEREINDSCTWVKEVLRNPGNRPILDKFFANCTGWRPDHMEILGDRESVLSVCAALVTLRWAWFTGYGFEPTLMGLWFVVNPNSQFNKEITRANAE